MDDSFDDMFDLTTPEGLVFIAATDTLDDEEPCSCWCGCERRVEWGGGECDPCLEGRHRGSGDLDDD